MHAPCRATPAFASTALATFALLAALSLAPASGATAAAELQPSWSRLAATVDGPRGDVVPLDRAIGLPPTIQDGIGPGSALQMGVDGIQTVCTAAFLLRDPATATYYLATAGHCLVRDADDAAPVTGRDQPEKAKNRVDICVGGCLNNGLGVGTYISLTAKGAYHPVAYAESGGVGRDFGIIELPADAHDLLRPALPQWGGPNGLDDGGTGDLVAHYGHGTLLVPGVTAFVTRTPADQGRLAVHGGSSGESFSAFGHVTGGDSGSAASLAVADATGVAQGTQALGVITHSIIYVGVPVMSGTLLSHGLGMVAERIGLRLDLVLEGDPLTAQAQGVPAAAHIAIVSPAPGATVRPVDGIVQVEGTASFGPVDDGVRIEVAIDDPSYGLDSRLPVTGNESWTASWYTGTSVAGTHILRARLVDADGAVLQETNQTVRLDRSTAPTSASPLSRGATPTSGQGTGDSAGEPVSITIPGPPALVVAAAVAIGLAVMRRRPGGGAR